MTRSFSTRAIHEGEGGDKTTGAHNTPIYQTATFAFERAEDFAAAIEIAVDPVSYTHLTLPTNREV